MGVITETRTVRLSLSEINGEHKVDFDFLLSPDYPPGRWQPGEVLRDQYVFRLPAALPGGEYIWQVILLRPDGSSVGEFMPGSSLRVIEPLRGLSAPEGTEQVDILLGNTVVLSGYVLGERAVAVGDQLALTLVWQAIAEIPESYRVFVHLLDQSGRLQAQSDGEPDQL